MPRKSNAPRTTVAHQCAHCGNDFFPFLQQLKKGHGDFCSARCSARSRATRSTFTCEQCGQTFDLAKWEQKQRSTRYCSHACAGAVRSISAEQRFWARVRKTDTCWLWTGKPNKETGYGRINLGAKIAIVSTHRFSYELHYGPISDPALFVCHTCDVRLCVRPDHLFLGTHADNLADMAKKLRAGKRRLIPDDVRTIRARVNAGETQTAVGKDYGIHQTTVRDIMSRKSWKHVA